MLVFISERIQVQGREGLRTAIAQPPQTLTSCGLCTPRVRIRN
jgi:hypothetical protein